MRTIDKRKFSPVIFGCHRLVCSKHKILDQFRCHIAVIRTDIYRISILIQYYLCFRKIKVDGTTLHTLFAKNCCQFCHLFKHRNQWLIFRHHLRIMVCQNFFHIGIRHTPVHADNGLCDCVINNFALRIDRHDAAECQPLFPLVEGTDSV